MRGEMKKHTASEEAKGPSHQAENDTTGRGGERGSSSVIRRHVKGTRPFGGDVKSH